MHLEEVVQQRQKHGVVVRHDEQVDARQRRARLQVTEGKAGVAELGAVGDVDLRGRGMSQNINPHCLASCELRPSLHIGRPAALIARQDDDHVLHTLYNVQQRTHDGTA